MDFFSDKETNRFYKTVEKSNKKIGADKISSFYIRYNFLIQSLRKNVSDYFSIPILVSQKHE